MTTSPTYGPLKPLETTARYTTVATVKRRLGIPNDDITLDTEVTRAIVAAEWAIDVENGRSFPDTGTDPAIDGIPEAIRQVAEDVSVAVYRNVDMVHGAAGSDLFVGEVNMTEVASQEVRRHIGMRGFKVAWGIG